MLASLPLGSRKSPHTSPHLKSAWEECLSRRSLSTGGSGQKSLGWASLGGLWAPDGDAVRLQTGAKEND